MSVIADVDFAPESFELGRIFRMEGGQDAVRIQIESMVPLGESIIPFVWVHNPHRDGFESWVMDHPSVETFEVREEHEDRALYAFAWDATQDDVITAIKSVGAQLLEGTGTESKWRFELRFPSHEALSQFQEYCIEEGVDFEVLRIYNPTKPDVGPWYGLSTPQREALVLAAREGYFDIPRRISTKALGDELGISDQAVTERMRRGLSRLLDHTVLVEELSEKR